MDATTIDALIDDRPEDGVFRVHADIFRRQDIFELEMKHLFEGGWVFVGLECQAAKPHDFFTTRIGRQPAIVMRDGTGALGGFVNSCRHKGSLVCHVAAGNRKHHVCPYHGWAYDSGGANVAVTGEAQGSYTAAFDRDDHGLRRVARFGNYRGFLFASLNPDVPPLEQHLGDSRIFIDLVVDQSAEGLELVPGTVTYTYHGNWKMQIENSADSYHFVPTHISYLKVLERRRPADGNSSIAQKFQQRDLSGAFTFENGHNVFWSMNPMRESRPLWLDLDAVQRRVGEVRAKWMFYTRNALFFPNMQLLENRSLQIRVNRPLSANETEITTYCVAPKGESRAARTLRIRQYEEFYNPSGLATSDDTTIFEDIEAGTKTAAVDWHQGYMRGLALAQHGTDAQARELGIRPRATLVATFNLGDETVFHGPLREWRRRLEAALGRAAARTRIAEPAK
jgi:phenylpropionate dioxygenase-like ring-hydroxylating dioxygenase large terminal subunit